ncbi:hypothetical protein [Azonexus sp.]|jgi:hypothetical protein|nr:hypothetical protein [Azonexus sp.]MDR1996478.1 hypothetical protein [Azonexus sp.]
MDMDFSAISAGLAIGGAVTAIIAMGALKMSPNFAKWATNKIASFF